MIVLLIILTIATAITILAIGRAAGRADEVIEQHRDKT